MKDEFFDSMDKWDGLDDTLKTLPVINENGWNKDKYFFSFMAYSWFFHLRKTYDIKDTLYVLYEFTGIDVTFSEIKNFSESKNKILKYMYESEEYTSDEISSISQSSTLDELLVHMRDKLEFTMLTVSEIFCHYFLDDFKVKFNTDIIQIYEIGRAHV